MTSSTPQTAPPNKWLWFLAGAILAFMISCAAAICYFGCQSEEQNTGPDMERIINDTIPK